MRPIDPRYGKIKLKQRRGAVVVFTAVSLITLLLCASLAVDVGYICALTAEAQNTADAGALAGATLLQEGKSDELVEDLHELIAMNQRPQGFLSLDDQIIEVGKWNAQEQTFHALPPDEWANEAFAVRVRAVRTNAPLFFAAIAGRTHTTVSREAVAVGSRPCRGVWGLEGITVNGNVQTDSYGPGSGPYNSLTALQNGDLCSGRDISIRGSIEVHGDVMSGSGYPVTLAGRPLITGVTTSNLENVTAPDLDYGDIAYSNDNGSMPLTSGGHDPIQPGNHFVVGTNDLLSVPPGNYYFSSVSVDSTSQILFTGPTLLYVTGDIQAAGAGLINSSQDAGNLTIVSTGDRVSLGGAFQLYATVIAPNADVRLVGTADVYGALIGRTVTMAGNFQFHVDESLAALDLIAPPPPFLVR